MSFAWRPQLDVLNSQALGRVLQCRSKVESRRFRLGAAARDDKEVEVDRRLHQHGDIETVVQTLREDD